MACDTIDLSGDAEVEEPVVLEDPQHLPTMMILM